MRASTALMKDRSTIATLDRLNQLIAEDMQAVNRLIVEQAESDIALIPQIAQYIIAAGGKRLRPALTLLAARLCGYRGDRHVRLAACVEFIHTATLLHDDVVDESKLRRGLATANDIFGNKASVLVGDYLLSKAFQLMVADGSLNILKLLSDASATIASGEVMQLAAAHQLSTDESVYLQVVEAKTAALFAAACEIGPMITEQAEYEPVLRNVGHALGIAFQLVDDALDYAANQEALGKSIGDDFREGKLTLPVILAYQQGNAEERSFWERTLGEAHDQRTGDLERAIQLLKHHNTLAATLARAESYCESARNLLSAFADSPEKQAFLDVIAFCQARAF